MSEAVTAIFEAMKDQARVDRVNNYDLFTGLLDSYDVSWSIVVEGFHVIVTTAQGVWDFYPGPEMYKLRHSGKECLSGAANFFVAAGILTEGGGVIPQEPVEQLPFVYALLSWSKADNTLALLDFWRGAIPSIDALMFFDSDITEELAAALRDDVQIETVGGEIYKLDKRDR
jgi:hypothetical protein